VTRPCIAILGGSFDPVHRGHLALAEYGVKLFRPDALRIVPAGLPWQKAGLNVAAEHRIAMLDLAFTDFPVPVQIDRQEIERSGNSYTIHTLQAIRHEMGPQAALVFFMGADQLKGLNTWRRWRDLFQFSHLCAVSRPGFSLDMAGVPSEVAEEFMQRMSTPEKIRASCCGLTYVATELHEDISSTATRSSLRQGMRPDALVPSTVLDYIQQHHLYQN
jgi:nicotinate-nucleotide adenylyltransferase